MGSSCRWESCRYSILPIATVAGLVVVCELAFLTSTKSPVEELDGMVQDGYLPSWIVPVIVGLTAVSGCLFLAGCFFSAKVAASVLVPQTLVDPLMYMEEAPSAGARLPPSRCSLCLCPPCAISGYETGDLLPRG